MAVWAPARPTDACHRRSMAGWCSGVGGKRCVPGPGFHDTPAALSAVGSVWQRSVGFDACRVAVPRDWSAGDGLQRLMETAHPAD